MGDAEALQAVYEAKALAELQAADSLLAQASSVVWSGDVFARVVLVKGRPGPADTESRKALAGEDGAAARKALGALGFEPDSVFATVSRLSEDEAACAERLALQIEAVDPAVVIALDPDAAQDVSGAAGLAELPPGEPTPWRGRVLLAVSGMEAALGDDDRKRSVWGEFKTLEGAI